MIVQKGTSLDQIEQKVPHIIFVLDPTEAIEVLASLASASYPTPTSNKILEQLLSNNSFLKPETISREEGQVQIE